jgi:hypothetical protein
MEFYTGKVGQDLRRQTLDFGSLDVSAYASGDIATTGALIAPEMARAQGLSGTILRLMVRESTSGTLQRPSIRFWFFGSSLTPASRNAPQAFTANQLANFIGTADVLNANYINCATGVSSVEVNINIPYVLQSTSTSIYVVPEFRGAYTFHSTASLIMQMISEVD